MLTPAFSSQAQDPVAIMVFISGCAKGYSKILLGIEKVNVQHYLEECHQTKVRAIGAEVLNISYLGELAMYLVELAQKQLQGTVSKTTDI